MSHRKLLIEGFHKGRDRTEDEAWVYGRRHAISWAEINSYGRSFPELSTKAQQLIEDNIGYLPEACIYIPHEPFLRAAIHEFETEAITADDFERQALFLLKVIRNDDMAKNGWAIDHPFTKEDYQRYESVLGAFKAPARTRITAMLGYEPILDHSLYAELYLRQLFQSDRLHAEMPFCWVDYRAATIYGYRKSLVIDGMAAADNSALFGRRN